MFTLIKNANLYSPEHLGMNDVLLADDKIALIDRKIELTGIPFDTIDAGGCAVTPGFIDQHVHITGGGGQTGYASLVPDVSMSELVACGTTTVVGLLGTDGFVKELTTLYAKTKALEDNGLSAYMLTSFYGLPPRTLMSCVADDLIFIDKVSLAAGSRVQRLPSQLRLLCGSTAFRQKSADEVAGKCCGGYPPGYRLSRPGPPPCGQNTLAH